MVIVPVVFLSFSEHSHYHEKYLIPMFEKVKYFSSASSKLDNYNGFPPPV